MSKSIALFSLIVERRIVTMYSIYYCVVYTATNVE